MSKKMSKVFFALGIAAALTACGQDTAPAGNLAKDITFDSTSQEDTQERESSENGMNEAPETQDAVDEDGVFTFMYEGTTLTPGALVDHETLPSYTSVSEVPSCAFGGNDNVYNFGSFELTTYFEEGDERVYSVYFIDPNLPTTEGLCLGDTVDDMKSLYGENYEAEGNACTYIKGKTVLNVITNNNIVVSIEYCLNIN